jgi:hypothetical protein
MKNEEIQEFLNSYDEIIEVCGSCFELLIELKALPMLDLMLEAKKIQPGFAERADALRKKVGMQKMREEMLFQNRGNA